MYTLKSIARRGTALGAAFAIFVASVVPSLPVAADALNPLTDRSLTLSSSAPGWDYLDGSGNTTYAPPNSGANGQKVGNTFDFKVSTDTTTGDNIKAITFQYCTSPAGNCTAPGNNGWTGSGPYARIANGPTAIAAKHSDLEVKVASPSQATLGTYLTNTSAASNQNPNGVVTSVPAAGTTGGNFLVYYVDDNATPGDDTDDTWVASPDWDMSVDNQETGDPTTGGAGTPPATGADNLIVLTNTGSGQGLKSGTRMKVVFFATDANYITNPGAGAFFVRMNTYKDDSTFTDANVIDGGVTVANVMNLGIQITTKVLETMDFSVGTVDPYTLQAVADDNGGTAGGANETSQFATAVPGRYVHNVCEPIRTKMDFDDANEPANRLQLGDPNAEFSLRTDTTYSTHSYWRLSSNSSAGATVYYSGNTLTNTVEDEIEPIGDAAEGPLAGSEQFGLALANGTIADNPQPAVSPFTSNVHKVNYNTERTSGSVFENGADNAATGLANPLSSGVDASVTDNALANLDANPSWHEPRLYPLLPDAEYDRGAGNINSGYGTVNTAFAFDPASMLVPVPFASQNDQVVNCVTGKMRYIANIAATTPAGIYTTKINYIAAPQY